MWGHTLLPAPELLRMGCTNHGHGCLMQQTHTLKWRPVLHV